jgi:hypothetical protein
MLRPTLTFQLNKLIVEIKTLMYQIIQRNFKISSVRGHLETTEKKKQNHPILYFQNVTKMDHVLAS